LCLLHTRIIGERSKRTTLNNLTKNELYSIMQDFQGMESYVRINADKKRAAAMHALSQSGAQLHHQHHHSASSSALNNNNVNAANPSNKATAQQKFNASKNLLNFAIPGDEQQQTSPPQAKQPTSRRDRMLSGITVPDVKVGKEN